MTYEKEKDTNEGVVLHVLCVILNIYCEKAMNGSFPGF